MYEKTYKGKYRNYDRMVDRYYEQRNFAKEFYKPCGHCGDKARMASNGFDTVCDNPKCPTNRFRNEDGSRNHGEPRREDRTRYLLIG